MLINGPFRRFLVTFAVFASSTPFTVNAEIVNWRTGETIPGTQDIVPGSGVDLVGWNTDEQNLRFADFQGANLRQARFDSSWLDNSDFNEANLTKADFTDALVAGALFGDTTSRGFTKQQLYSTASYKARDLRGIQLGNNNLSGWSFAGQNLSDAGLGRATLTEADLTGAEITGASFGDTTSQGFTKEQLYSTASYQMKNLSRVDMRNNDMTGWNFASQVLVGADFGSGVTLTAADLTGAVITGASFGTLTKEQLYSTASYKMKNLSRVDMPHDMTGWNLADQVLVDADFRGATLSNADLTNAHLINANLRGATFTDADLTGALVTGASFMRSQGFTKEQLYSTASYQMKNLSRVDMRNNDMTGWNFADQVLANTIFHSATLTEADLANTNLTNANFRSATLTETDLANADLTNADFSSATLTGADLTNADLTNADFGGATLADADLTGAIVTGHTFGTLTKEQLYSTASYQMKDLSHVRLRRSNDMSGWDFAGQALVGAVFGGTLTNANLANADLTDAAFHGSRLTNADLTGAIITGVSFGKATLRGFTKEQLYSTASYQMKNLSGVRMVESDMTGWNFSGQVLLDADFRRAILTDADLTGAVIAADFGRATLTDADLTGALITGASFENTTSQGFTKEQLYSTASYRSKDLRNIILSNNDLSAWNFSGQNLTDADFDNAILTNADLTGAIITGAFLKSATLRGFTKEQLYSTASYQVKNLSRVDMRENDLTGWNFSGQVLLDADFRRAILTDADLTGAVITGASFGTLTKEQLYSTASYQMKNLSRVDMPHDMTGWNLAGQVLVDADFGSATLTDADLTDAVITGASFRSTTSQGFTKEQLYSTASYRSKDLKNTSLRNNNLSGWNFSGQNLTGANFEDAILTDADLTGSTIIGADFEDTNLSAEQLYSTASYRSGELQGINLEDQNMTSWVFSDQNLADSDLEQANLTRADLSDVNLTDANLSRARLRLADLSNANLTGANLTRVSLPLADLSGANLKNANLTSATLTASSFQPTTVYNQWTVFPNHFFPTLAGLTLVRSSTGDFDANGALDVEDIVLLTERIREGDDFKQFWLDEMFDINSDSSIDREDVTTWVKGVMQTWFGDTNLDGKFNSNDLVAVFQAGEYEDGILKNSGWATGDWNTDGEFDSSDLVLAFRDGGYEQGLPAVNAVPEPTSATMLIIGLIGIAIVSRRCNSSPIIASR